MAEQKAPAAAEKPAEKQVEKPAKKASRDEVLARAAGSSDPAVQDLLAHRATAVLNQDDTALAGIDEALAALVD